MALPTVWFDIYFNVKYGENPSSTSFDGAKKTDLGIILFWGKTLQDLPIPTHPALIFDGWYASDNFEESSKLYDSSEGLVYPQITSGDIQLYAKWKSIPVYCGSMELIEIADTIREKTGETGEIMLNDMKDKITSIKIEAGTKVETCTISTYLYDGSMAYVTVSEETGEPICIWEPNFYHGNTPKEFTIVKNTIMYIFHLNAYGTPHTVSGGVEVLSTGGTSISTNGMSSSAYLYKITDNGTIESPRTNAGSMGEK